MSSGRQRQPDRARHLGYAPILFVLFVLFALGCAPMSKQANGYAVAGELAGGSYAYDGDFGGAADGAETDAMVMTKFKAPGRAERSRDVAPSPTTTASSSTSASPGPEPKPTPEPEPQDQAASSGRQIIYTAGMGVSVFDVAETMAKLEAIPERYGGWLDQRYDNSLILRVPADQLQIIIREVSTWGVVDWKTLEALDVTAQYTDLESRIRVLEQMHEHLAALLAKAVSVEQALEIQVELGRITAELERLRAQMRMLASSIEFSTLAVELHRRGTSEPEPGNDPFGWVDELGAEATAYN